MISNPTYYPLHSLLQTPFSSIDPPTINCFYMKKPVSSHNIIIAILVILSYKNKTKRKNIHKEKTLMTTFSYMNKTTKVILLSTFVYYFLLVFNTRWLETVRL